MKIQGNYKSLKNVTKNKLLELVISLYSVHGVNNIIIKDNGEILLIKKKLFFGIIKIGTKIPIFNLIFNEIPKAICYHLWASGDFTKYIREELNRIISENEIYAEAYKTTKIIDYLYSLFFGIEEKETIVDKVINDFKRNIVCKSLRSAKSEENENVTVELLSSSIAPEEEDEGGIFDLFNELLKGRPQVSRRIINTFSLFLALNAFRIIGLLSLNEGKLVDKPTTELLFNRRCFLDSS